MKRITVWSEDAPSREYMAIEQLAERVPGILLLTATPEQLGMESHFARLRLLDPSRFHDFAQFVEEQKLSSGRRRRRYVTGRQQAE